MFLKQFRPRELLRGSVVPALLFKLLARSTSSCSVQEACVLCVGGYFDHHDLLSATVYVPEWVESWLQEFGAAFVYALDMHSHG